MTTTNSKPIQWSGRGQAPLEAGDWVQIIGTRDFQDEFPKGMFAKIESVKHGVPGFPTLYWVAHPYSLFLFPFTRENLFGPIRADELPASFDEYRNGYTIKVGTAQ